VVKSLVQNLQGGAASRRNSIFPYGQAVVIYEPGVSPSPRFFAAAAIEEFIT